MNLSFQFYRLFPDVYMSVDYGVTVAKVYLAARMIGAAVSYVESQVSAIVMYCGRHGIVEGLKYYAVLGDRFGPNGVFSFIENADKGDSGTQGTRTLYRVMSEEEYNSLMKNGKFTYYSEAMEDKWFATTEADAVKWAEWFYPDGKYKMVGIEVYKSSLEQMYYSPKLDNIGPAYCSPIDVINQAIKSIKEIK